MRLPSHVLVIGLCFLLLGCAGPRSSGPAPQIAERTAALPKSQGAIGGLARDLADGHPLSMVSVQAEQEGVRVAHDISDHEGNYRLGPLAPGYYDVRAKFASGRVFYESIHVVAHEQTKVNVDIDLRSHTNTSSVIETGGASGTIEGTVLDGPQGNPFPAVVVSLSADHMDDTVMSFSDENGRFQFRGLRPGVYAVGSFYTLVEQGNVEIRRSNIVVRPGETTVIEVVFDLRLR